MNKPNNQNNTTNPFDGFTPAKLLICGVGLLALIALFVTLQVLDDSGYSTSVKQDKAYLEELKYDTCPANWSKAGQRYEVSNRLDNPVAGMHKVCGSQLIPVTCPADYEGAGYTFISQKHSYRTDVMHPTTMYYNCGRTDEQIKNGRYPLLHCEQKWRDTYSSFCEGHTNAMNKTIDPNIELFQIYALDEDGNPIE